MSEDDLSELLARGEALVGACGVGHREGLGDRHLDHARRQQRHDVGLDCSGDRGLLGFGASPEGRPGEKGASRHHLEKVDLDLRARTADPDHHDPPSGREQRQHRGHTGRADQLERDVEGSVRADAVGLDHQVGPERPDRIVELGVPHRGDDDGAGRVGELHGRGPHSSGRSRHEHSLSHREVRPAEQRVVRGREDLRKPSRLLEGNSWWDRHQRALRHDDQLCLASTAAEPHDPVAEREARCASAESGHLTRELHPRDVLRPAGRSRVATPHLHGVCSVDPGRPDRHQHLSPPGDRVLVVTPLEGPLDDGHRAHRPRLSTVSITPLMVTAGGAPP